MLLNTKYEVFPNEEQRETRLLDTILLSNL